MSRLAKKIKDLRTSLMMNQPEFAKAVGDVDQSTVSKWENDKQRPRPEQMVRLAELANVTPQQFLGVQVVNRLENNLPTVQVTGALQAGSWSEALEWPEEDRYQVPAPPLPPEWDDVTLHAREVHGNSMNRYYPDGSIVYICPITILGRKPKSGEKVAVQRVTDAGYEVTLKEYVIGDDGKVWLWPRSTDPEHQQPLPYIDPRRHTESVRIIGVVVGSLVMEASRV